MKMQQVMPVPRPDPTQAERNAELKIGVFKTIRDRIKYHLVSQTISDTLELVGITIVPYYTFEEFFSDKLSQGLNPESSLTPLEGGFLSYQEVERLCSLPECGELAMDKEKLRDNGCRCFALKHNGEVVSYMLCNFQKCDSRLNSFPLSGGEVYLTGAFTFNAYRGKNLVTLVEYELYKKLSEMGLNKYHSINVVYNAPSLKFKEKLKSKPAKLRLFVSLFNKFQWNITMKRYRR